MSKAEPTKEDLKKAKQMAETSNVKDLSQLKDKNNQPQEEEDEPEISWEQLLEEVELEEGYFMFRKPTEKKTKDGHKIILPDGSQLLDDNEYRPVIEKLGPIPEDKNLVAEEGDHVMLMPQATKGFVQEQYRGHDINILHIDYILGPTKQ